MAYALVESVEMLMRTGSHSKKECKVMYVYLYNL